jgi:hypothetical protein
MQANFICQFYSCIQLKTKLFSYEERADRQAVNAGAIEPSYRFAGRGNQRLSKEIEGCAEQYRYSTDFAKPGQKSPKWGIVLATNGLDPGNPIPECHCGNEVTLLVANLANPLKKLS